MTVFIDPLNEDLFKPLHLCENRPFKGYLSEAEINLLLNVEKDPTEELILHLVLCMGMRRDESVQLQISSIDFKNRCLLVKNSVCRRIVPFAAHILGEKVFESVLRNYLYFREDLLASLANKSPGFESDQLLIHNHRGKLKEFDAKGNSFSYRVKSIAANAGVDTSILMLRRTYAHIQYTKGVSVEDISCLMGIQMYSSHIRKIHMDYYLKLVKFRKKSRDL